MTYTERNIVEAYSTLFNNLSDVCKAALAERLSKAEKKERKVEDNFALSFGGWEGPDQSVDEIKAEIKANRKFRKKEPVFL